MNILVIFSKSEILHKFIAFLEKLCYYMPHQCKRGIKKMFENSIGKVKVEAKTSHMYLVMKRGFDIIVSLIGLVFLIPIIAIIKIISVCSGDFDSIFYTHDRIGKDGKIFKLYKFRSMVPHADEILMKLLEEDEEIRKEYTEMKKLENDPRITKIGKFIRKTSIDELPQILNILKGDMSLIGNRPYMPREKDDMLFYYNDIVKTKPGLTGYWQVNLRSRGTFEDRLKMEKFYSNNYSFKLDVKIFFKTFAVVFKRDGAK